MSIEIQERIRRRAHAIWEAQGHPDGLAEEHWHQAEAEIAQADAMSQTSSPLATGVVRKEPGKSAKGEVAA
ncbi:DUF2934 domain-containing protein [Sphingobium ummariense]|uniref:DUF2934 domain-containing protein n=1 Tax=Sphingobium ummariense RL-3 TaxID=1346791 RepID=T0KAC5_9SPHN|nr:DUF2934 domain-containing protein [Sphingobium ummariense]EQB30089.1 hypothetical protein M529_21790 [Sphingobium ummariense RL-3]EQB30393.1 hypothetical protein M529_18755 [Sphingobium ummariense RL-3]